MSGFAGFHEKMARAFQSVGKTADARSAAILWFRATAEDENVNDDTARRMAAIILGHEPTAEDWDRLPELVVADHCRAYPESLR